MTLASRTGRICAAIFSAVCLSLAFQLLQPASAEAKGLKRQTGRVVTSCFPGKLRGVLAKISARYGRPVIVTSGYRSRGRNRRAGGASRSYHVRCMAADVQVRDVRPSAIARYARSLPAVGGVGVYRHTRSVHIDVGSRKFTWHRGFNKRRHLARSKSRSYRLVNR